MARLKYNQGFYSPQKKEKYKGSYPIVYRSSLELSFMRWADRNDNVLSWGSESVVIPYLSPKDGKSHKYFVDFILKLSTPNGEKKFIVEVKPEKQIHPPDTKYRKKKGTVLYEQLTYAVNLSKWDAARQWANRNGYEFTIITDKDLRSS